MENSIFNELCKNMLYEKQTWMIRIGSLSMSIIVFTILAIVLCVTIICFCSSWIFFISIIKCLWNDCIKVCFESIMKEAKFAKKSYDNYV